MSTRVTIRLWQAELLYPNGNSDADYSTTDMTKDFATYEEAEKYILDFFVHPENGFLVDYGSGLTKAVDDDNDGEPDDEIDDFAIRVKRHLRVAAQGGYREFKHAYDVRAMQWDEEVPNAVSSPRWRINAPDWLNVEFGISEVIIANVEVVEQ